MSINPLFLQDTASGDAGNFVNSNLFDLDRERNVIAEPWSLASEPPIVSPDGLSYTIKLKPEAKWSDGQPVTADDIKYTFDTIKNPDAASPGITTFDKVESVTKVDDLTVTVKMKQIYAPFLFALVTPVVPPIS